MIEGLQLDDEREREYVRGGYSLPKLCRAAREDQRFVGVERPVDLVYGEGSGRFGHLVESIEHGQDAIGFDEIARECAVLVFGSVAKVVVAGYVLGHPVLEACQ